MSDSNSVDVVLYEVSASVALITLNRPAQLNAWTPTVDQEYGRALERAGADPDVRVVIVAGSGRAFCSGADLSVLGHIRAGHKMQAPRDSGRGRRSIRDFAPAVPKPVIAAVHGACLGIGFAHALACDLRFTTAESQWGAVFARRGLAAEQGTAWLLPRLVGAGRAADLLFSGRMVTGGEAARIGLADQVVPGDSRTDVISAARHYAEMIAFNCSPTALAAIKQQLERSAESTFAQAIQDSARTTRELLRGPDFRDSVQAFRDGRPPRFGPLPQA